MDSMNNKLCEIIDHYDVISFDVFDTLILRKCNALEDVFAYVARKIGECECDFVAKRVKAEHEVRKEKKREITIKDIYSQMESDPERVKQYIYAEEEAELQLCTCNREMKCVYDSVKQQGKHVYIISDMYMNFEFMDTLLKHNGYEGHDHLYVSSEIGVAKSNGKLYSYVLGQSEVAAARVLHIGDNYKSDYLMPKLKGMKSYWYRA